MNNILQNEEIVNLNDYFSDKIYGRIYKITNMITGRIYIGQTTKTIKQRFNAHMFGANHNSKNYIHRSMRKYGIENFIVEEIGIAYSLSELNQKEYDWIIKENCLAPNGYNLRSGGNHKGISEETRQKLSIILKNRIFTAEHRKNLSKSIKGRTYSDEIKEKFRQVQLGKKHTYETKQKMSRSQMKHYVSDETRQKISQTHINKPKSLNHRIKISQSLTNYDPGIWYYNPETNISKRILFDQEIPFGFIKGRPEKDTNKNSRCYYNPFTHENKLIKEGNNIPDGFILGRYTSENTIGHTKNKKWYYNPETNKSVMLSETDIIPNGFIKGRGKINWSKNNENI